MVMRFLSCMAAAFACGCSIPSTGGDSSPLRIVVPGVGQGEGCLAIHGGRAIAFDAGPSSSAVLSSHLRNEAVGSLEVLVISHWDLDHVGGLDSLISHGQVERIVHAAEPVDGWMRRCKADWCARIPGGCILVAEGDRLGVLGGFVLEIIRTAPDAPMENDRSLVARLVSNDGEGLLLAPGDLDTAGEAELVAKRADLHARTLLAGHHGSRGSSSLPFLGAVRPATAFVQAGSANTYGHPHIEAMERLREVVPDVRVIRESMLDSVVD